MRQLATLMVWSPLLLVATVTGGSMAAQAAAIQDTAAPPEPTLNEAILPPPELTPADPATGDHPLLAAADLGANDRAAVVDSYRTRFQPQFTVPNGWTGSTASCHPGTNSIAYQQATEATINWYREMTGLPPITLDPALDAEALAAALIMQANNTLTHYPSSDLACWTPEGADGAGSSNLALGAAGPRSIALYIEDPGASNTPVGHRRWILYPPMATMGSGSTSWANALKVFGGPGQWGARPAGPEWVSWPPEGYVPQATTYPRWSLARNSAPGADFSAATVTMHDGAQEIPVIQHPVSNGYGDNTIVWEPQGLSFSPGMADRTFTITVSGIRVAGSAITHRYQVTVIDPDVDPPPPDGFSVLDTPCPVYDSTVATRPELAGTLAPGEVRTIQVSGPLDGQGGAPSCIGAAEGATAVMYTVSAKDPQALGNLRLSPSGVVPNGGVVNYAANGLNNANTVTVPLPPSGQVRLEANAGATDVRLVVVGYYASDGQGLELTTVTPCAVSDSRTATGAWAGPFAAGSSIPPITVTGTIDPAQGAGTGCGIPDSVAAVALNVVSVQGSGGTGHLSVGGHLTEPLTPFSGIGLNNATSIVVPTTPDGSVTVGVGALSGSPSTHVRVVALGYYTTSGAAFEPVDPCAGFDTRPFTGASGLFAGPRADQSTTTYRLVGAIPAAQGGGGGNCGVPAGASAVLVNLVAIDPSVTGNLRASAAGTPALGGVLNFASLTPAMNNSNTVVVPLSAAGEISVTVHAPPAAGGSVTHIRGVILGYLH